MNVQSPVDIFFSKDIVWSVMREQEFCWQEINLKLPMEERRTPTHILNAGKKKKKKNKLKIHKKNPTRNPKK